LSSQATILNQIQNGVDYYASQSSIIQSSIATNFQGYTLIAIDSTAIKTSIQITSFPAEARTFTASFSNVLVLQSTGSSQVDPNLVFSNFTSLVEYFRVLINLTLQILIFFFQKDW
jgi:hypothetical protein